MRRRGGGVSAQAGRGPRTKDPDPGCLGAEDEDGTVPRVLQRPGIQNPEEVAQPWMQQPGAQATASWAQPWPLGHIN